MNVNDYNLFSVPVSLYNNFLPPELAENIKNYILTEKADAGRENNVLHGEGKSSYMNMDEQARFIQDVTENVPGCSKFSNNILECINDFTSKINFPVCTLGNSWFNIQQPGSMLRRHAHISVFGIELVSGALYINVDDKSSSMSFENPNPWIVMSPGEAFTFTIKPKIGDLILFPSWLMHQSLDSNMTENRIVISFNAR
jgi:uncharacterized protein (TIGR02466 family)